MKVKLYPNKIRTGHFLAAKHFNFAPEARVNPEDLLEIDAIVHVESDVYRVVSADSGKAALLYASDVYEVEIKENSNVLANMACPNCGRYESFFIQPCTSDVMSEFTDDGCTSETVGDLEWHRGSRCVCPGCSFTGHVFDFEGPHKELDEIQQLVIENYEYAPAVQRPADLADCGDGLFKYLMTELSQAEGCENLEQALKRLDNTLRDVNAIRDAVIRKLG